MTERNERERAARAYLEDAENPVVQSLLEANLLLEQELEDKGRAFLLTLLGFLLLGFLGGFFLGAVTR